MGTLARGANGGGVMLAAAMRSAWAAWRSRRAPHGSSGIWSTPPVTSAQRPSAEERPASGQRRQAPRYTRILPLGGTESSVWLSVRQGSEGVCQLVVLKTLREGASTDGAALLRLMDEARLTARMNHPNVVRAYGLEREGGHPVLELEYLAGQSLATLLACANDLRAFSQELRVAIVARLLRGLDYLHRLHDFDGRPLRAVHDGIAPANLVITYDGEVKLIDLSRARVRVWGALDQPARRRLPYAPPESFSGEPDQRGDIFSAGVILWELLAGKPLWGRMPVSTVVRSLLSGDIPRLKQAVPGVDVELDRICARALAPHPDARYRSAGEMRGDLERYLLGRNAWVSDAAIAELVCTACREQRREAKKVIDARLSELGLRLSHGQRAAATAPGARFTPRQRRFALGCAAAGLAIAVCSGLLLRREGEVVAGNDTPASASGPDRAGAAAAGDRRVSRAARDALPTPPGGRLVEVDVNVQPRHAALYIDGRRLSSNPLRAVMVWDSGLHTLRCEAEGFEQLVTTFRLDSPLKIDETLRPVSPARPSSGQRSRDSLGSRRSPDSRWSAARPALGPGRRTRHGPRTAAR